MGANLIDKRHHHTTATTMPLIQFRAGRRERRQNTKWVDPQPGKGLISLEQSNEDGLMHFQYKDLESNTLIDASIPPPACFLTSTSLSCDDVVPRRNMLR